jgi:transglycosylase-like protein
LLIKRTHIAHVLIATALALPAAAFAADSTKVSIGISKAKPIAISRIAPPLAHFHHTIRVVKRQIAAARRAELRRQRREAFASLPAGVSIATLEAIAACESGGDPTIVSSDGSYRGKYQFDFGTWEAVGGSGDPAAAPEAEQDYRAALLYVQSGSSPWPVCG